eukprot:SAG11_NODE_645_length_7983_cov_5.727596_7_plen_72_part_00
MAPGKSTEILIITDYLETHPYYLVGTLPLPRYEVQWSWPGRPPVRTAIMSINGHEDLRCAEWLRECKHTRA